MLHTLSEQYVFLCDLNLGILQMVVNKLLPSDKLKSKYIYFLFTTVKFGKRIYSVCKNIFYEIFFIYLGKNVHIFYL